MHRPWWLSSKPDVWIVATGTVSPRRESSSAVSFLLKRLEVDLDTVVYLIERASYSCWPEGGGVSSLKFMAYRALSEEEHERVRGWGLSVDASRVIVFGREEQAYEQVCAVENVRVVVMDEGVLLHSPFLVQGFLLRGYRVIAKVTSRLSVDTFAVQGGAPSTVHLDCSRAEAAPGAISLGENSRCRALYDYDARDEEELTLRVGDIITVLQQLDSGWWQAQDSQGRKGMVPSNFIGEADLFDQFTSPDKDTCPICRKIVRRGAHSITWSAQLTWHTDCRKKKVLEDGIRRSEAMKNMCHLCNKPILEPASNGRPATEAEMQLLNESRRKELSKILVKAISASTRFLVFKSYQDDLASLPKPVAFYAEFWKISDYARTSVVMSYLDRWHATISHMEPFEVAVLPLPGDGGMGMQVLNLETGDADSRW